MELYELSFIVGFRLRLSYSVHSKDVPKMTPRRVRLRRALVGDRQGTAAVEFALLVPLLVALAIGTVDYGALIYQIMQVNAAAHAGAQYAIRNGFSASGIEQAETSATGLTLSATPAPQLTEACIVGGAIVATAGSTCPAGGSPGSYILISAQSAVTPIVSWPSFTMPASVSAQAMIRIH